MDGRVVEADLVESLWLSLCQGSRVIDDQRELSVASLDENYFGSTQRFLTGSSIGGAWDVGKREQQQDEDVVRLNTYTDGSPSFASPKPSLPS